MYFPRNWESGSALSKLRNFRGGFEHPTPSVRHWQAQLWVWHFVTFSLLKVVRPSINKVSCIHLLRKQNWFVLQQRKMMENTDMYHSKSLNWKCKFNTEEVHTLKLQIWVKINTGNEKLKLRWTHLTLLRCCSTYVWLWLSSNLADRYRILTAILSTFSRPTS